MGERVPASHFAVIGVGLVVDPTNRFVAAVACTPGGFRGTFALVHQTHPAAPNTTDCEHLYFIPALTDICTSTRHLQTLPPTTYWHLHFHPALTDTYASTRHLLTLTRFLRTYRPFHSSSTYLHVLPALTDTSTRHLLTLALSPSTSGHLYFFPVLITIVHFWVLRPLTETGTFSQHLLTLWVSSNTYWHWSSHRLE